MEATEVFFSPKAGAGMMLTMLAYGIPHIRYTLGLLHGKEPPPADLLLERLVDRASQLTGSHTGALLEAAQQQIQMAPLKVLVVSACYLASSSKLLRWGNVRALQLLTTFPVLLHKACYI